MLQRVLAIIKSLDDKCAELSSALSHHTSRLLALPPKLATAAGPATDAGAAVTPAAAAATAEYASLMHRVAVDQELLGQFAEEKVCVCAFYRST
jgi:hypothetical protein